MWLKEWCSHKHSKAGNTYILVSATREHILLIFTCLLSSKSLVHTKNYESLLVVYVTVTSYLMENIFRGMGVLWHRHTKEYYIVTKVNELDP